MEKSTKWIIGIGSVMLIGTGVGLWLYNKSKDKANSGDNKDKDKDKDKDNKDKDNSGSGDTYNPAPSYTPSSSGVPFTNTAEGNKFRAWVNKTHLSYAKSIKLDVMGSYNNSFIKKAWAEYGDEYQKSTGTQSVPKTANSNFTDLLKNTGLVANKDNIAIAKFNGGKNTAQFYTNGRIFIFDSNKKNVAKGNYANGGRQISIDGMSPISSNSVWANLENIIK